MQRVSSVLAATDFSRHAGYAVGRATLLAGALSGRLQLLHVVGEAPLAALRAVFPGTTANADDIVRQAQKALDEEARRAAGRAAAQVETRVAIGDPLTEIHRAAGEADLLVLGALGSNRLRDLIVGTTAERLLRKSTKPVLMVRQAARHAYRRVIVGIDFSPDASAALEAARLLAPQADITALHAVDLPLRTSYFYAGIEDEAIRRCHHLATTEAKEKLRDALRARASDALPVEPRVQIGNPSAAILSLARHAHADLVALGKHGRSFAEEMLLGSAVRHVAADAECDVLVVPRPDAPQ